MTDDADDAHAHYKRLLADTKALNDAFDRYCAALDTQATKEEVLVLRESLNAVMNRVKARTQRSEESPPQPVDTSQPMKKVR